MVLNASAPLTRSAAAFALLGRSHARPANGNQRYICAILVSPLYIMYRHIATNVLYFNLGCRSSFPLQTDAAQPCYAICWRLRTYACLLRICALLSNLVVLIIGSCRLGN